MNEEASALTYREVGATADARLPGGYAHLHVTRQIGVGRAWFDEAARRLMGWEMHRRAGLRVDTDRPVALHQSAVLRIRIGPLPIAAPVRVVQVIDEPRRRGFAWFTRLAGPLGRRLQHATTQRYLDALSATR